MSSISGCPITADPTRSAFYRNTAAATHVKLVSLLLILVASAAGISFPVILSRLFKNTPSYSYSLTLIKSFAAGVILSTSLVHVLPDAFASLSDRHVSLLDFPVAGLVCLAGALLALLVDVAASSHIEGGGGGSPASKKPNYVRIEKIGGCHSGGVKEEGVEDEDGEERIGRLKQRMVSKVLEIGIIFHSVFIGVCRIGARFRCSWRRWRFIRYSRGWASAAALLR